MVRIALVLLAVLVLVAAVAAPDPSSRPGTETTPFYRMEKGQTVECSQAEGCVAMTAEAYRQLIRGAYERGADRCMANKGAYL